MKAPCILVLATLGLTAASCGDRSDDPEVSPPAATGDSHQTEHGQPPARPPETAIDVPQISVRPAPPDAEQRAEQLNLQGMTAYNAKDHAAAIAQFVAALEVDPAAHQARYNLACALAQSGDGRGALEQLEQLQNGNCTPCRDKLDRARMDKDLAILRGHPRFEAIVEN